MFDEGFLKTTLTPILAIIGAVFGLIGTALGILNYRLAKQRHRVCLKVEVGSYLVTSENQFESLTFKVKVVNAGYAPVTISEFGLRVRKSWIRTQRVPFDTTASRASGRMHQILPVRIEPHDEKMLERQYSTDGLLAHGIKTSLLLSRADAVYVKTSTGKVFYGRGNGWPKFIERAEAREGLRPATEWQQ